MQLDLLKTVKMYGAAILLVCGAGLFVYGFLSFHPAEGGDPNADVEYGGSRTSTGYWYDTKARTEAAIGAGLMLLGGVLYKQKTLATVPQEK